MSNIVFLATTDMATPFLEHPEVDYKWDLVWTMYSGGAQEVMYFIYAKILPN